ncbi:hypothetical protein C9374_002896 [Naegleria lovaniensis]|uniref:Guanylate cyclase domain-containing protein n=1 Tax=Naegleria lovaniensis TaxID=51637 RepID=A0AA88GN63_NAELO|nr:uncharacterized protein C9374_002896 [Naegleria lovaniensis]KAG2385747.1 hypothetical protein C9374_002896 [Naegleria lovaniensis]
MGSGCSNAASCANIDTTAHHHEPQKHPNMKTTSGNSIPSPTPEKLNDHENPNVHGEGKANRYHISEDTISVSTTGSSTISSKPSGIEVRKAYSFKIPEPRLNFVGFNFLNSHSGVNKEPFMTESNLLLYSSFLPQHLFYNMKSVYYSNISKDSKMQGVEKILDENNLSQISPLSNFSYDTCILMLDVSGFTPLTETLSKEPNGAELLTKYMNNYFTTLISYIYEFGGDVEKFSGDALICQFYYPRKDRTLTDCLIAAVQCALKIQGTEQLRVFKINNEISLHIHCGISIGKVVTHHIGGVSDYWLRITHGQALLEMASALSNSKVGEVVLTKQAYERCKQFITCRQVEGVNEEVYLAISSKRQVASNLALPKISFHASFGSVIRKFVSPPVRKKIEAGQQDWLNEIKPLTVGFLSVSDTNTYATPNDEMNAYHMYLETIQKILDHYEGFIANMVADEKGTILVFAFGYPLTHISDPIRAVKAGTELTTKLKQGGFKFGIGIATGKCFIGCVGCSQRQEFTCYGDKVNLAARLMKESEKLEGCIICDEETSSLLKGIPVETLEPIKVKGKSEPIKVSRVIDASIQNQHMYFNSFKNQTDSNGTAMKNTQYTENSSLDPIVSSNNTPISSQTEQQETNNKMLISQQPCECQKRNEFSDASLEALRAPIGREDIFEQICSVVSSKLQEFENGEPRKRSKVILVKGDVGLGKSDLFTRLAKEWRTKIACVYNSAIEFETPFYLFLGNVKISVAERVCKKYGLEMRYDNIDAIYSSITREQKEELLLSTFTSESDRKHLFLINDVFGVYFEDSSNDGEKLESSQRVSLAANLVARFLSLSWLDMKYENQAWFLLYDSFHYVDPYSRAKETETLLQIYSNAESVDQKALDIIYEKTDGNQMFVTMGTHFLHDQQKLFVEDGVLKVKTTSLDGLEIPASMASLWHHKLDRLDHDTQLVLKVASACGMKFNIETLLTIFPESPLKQEEQRIVQILNDLVTQYKILELIDETKEKSFLCSSSSEKASFYKFKSSMILDILYSKNREKSTWYILEIASHYGEYFDKVHLEEILSGDQILHRNDIYHVACAILFISKGLHLLGNHGAEIVKAKHLFTSLIYILENIIVTWFEKDKYEIAPSSSNSLNRKNSVRDGNKIASQTIVGMNRASCKEFLSKLDLKYAGFLQALSDNNLMTTSNNSLKNALKYCPKKNRELYFDIYCEIWFHSFYYDLTDEALVTSSELLNLANDIGADYMQMYAYIACMMSNQTKGNFSKVAFFSDEIINQYLSDPEKYHKMSIHNFRKRDALLLSCTFAMRSLWCMGRYEKAQYYFNLGTEHSKMRLHLPSFIFFYTFTCYYLLLSRQIDELETRAAQGLQVMTIFSNNVTLPLQELGSKFYAKYVRFVRATQSTITGSSNASRDYVSELREMICHMESLFQSMNSIALPISFSIMPFLNVGCNIFKSS